MLNRSIIALLLMSLIGKLASKIYKRKSSGIYELESIFQDVENSKAIHSLENLGWSGVFKLEDDLVEDLRAVFEMDRKDGCVLNPHVKYKCAERIIRNDLLNHVVKGYFEVQPRIYRSVLFMSNEKSIDEINLSKCSDREFHFDVPDVKSLNLFIYLNDVDEFGGAHSLILSTHKNLGFRKVMSRKISYENALKKYGRSRVLDVIGPKGTSFLTVPTGYHRRMHSNKPRLVLLVNYTFIR